MFQFIANLFRGSSARVRLTALKISWALGVVFALTFIGVLPAFFGTPIVHSFYLSFPIWIFSAYRIFAIWRYLHVAVAGEVLDSLQAIGPETNQTIWDSELAANYRKYAINVWLAQTIIFLAAPLYFNLTSGGRLWLPVLIMVVFAIAMISVNAGLWIFRTAAVLTIAIFLLVAGYDMFPQVGYIPFVSDGVAKLKVVKLAGENAKALGEIDALRQFQRQNQLAQINKVAVAWQVANPGKDFPTEIKRAMVAVKEGLTLEEFEVKLKAEADAKAKAEEEAKKAEADAKAKAKKEETEKLAENKAEKLAKETSAPKEALTTPRVIKIEVEKNSYSWKTIPAGNYKLEPRTVRVKTNINDRSEESNGLLSLSQDTLVYFYPPMGLEICHVLLTKN